MAQPTISDVHIDRPLTSMMAAFYQDAGNFVAAGPNPVFPAIPVTNKSDLYFKLNRGDFFRDDMQERAPGDPAAESGYKLTTENYNCKVWALLKKIPDQIRRNTDAPLNPDKNAIQFLTQKAMINRDKQWCSKYFTTGVWGYEKAGQASADSTHVVYWNSTGSTPIDDVMQMHLAVLSTTGYEANVAVMSARTYYALLTNAQLIDRLKYGQTAPGPVEVTDQDLCNLFKVKRVCVAKAVQTTSAENTNVDSDTSDTFDFIAGKNFGLFYAADAPSIDSPSAGYTFNWIGQQGVSAAGLFIKKYRWEINAADHVEVEQNYDFGLVSRYLGSFLYNVIQ